MGTKKPSNLTLRPIVMSIGIRLSRFPWRKWAKSLLLISVVSIVSLLAIDRWVTWQTQNNIINDTDNTPPFQVAVVLGTSKYIGKTLNEYYTNRIDAAIELYQQGKVRNFLLSGDNAHRSYNEPWTMKRDLLRAGIPAENISLDYAGFRTLDSIVRAKQIFDTNNFLIITQRFHCERALFIAHYQDIQASCLAVPGPSSHSGFKVRLREVFARAYAVFDLFVLDTKPKFLGPKEPIIVESSGSEPEETEAPAQ
ncbi:MULTISPECIES: SanA/YdcF family protein [Vibrio]|uniref:SanA n=1 Tax=Vibrio metoecus TaxID=1481663 RepID=A0A0N8UJA4_VIBMT|nr:MULTISPECIES: vancomycin high temperature exclusion protein [Vibrio]KQA27842.1 SanA [Vibrio metoecus]KQB02186.1 SanA [Vibrio metoecus]KQB10282.1 SanA [Vibrio metoecus]MCR9386357.1 vancomycin high temperature exclusion protein [Vibrio metoecus]MDP4492630.1 vancomycin high temperature exclusion protein [Vibrio sp. AH4]